MLNPRSASACLAMFVLLGVWSESAEAQLPWRGHYVRRDGLFHTERMRWGGGLTANGASVINTALPLFAPIIGGLIGKEEPSRDESSRDAQFRDANWCAGYAVQLQRANDLLERTAKLVNYPSTGEESVPTDSGLPAAGKEFGTESPWKPRPSQ